MSEEVQQRGIWQSTFVARPDTGAPHGQATTISVVDADEDAQTFAMGWNKPALYRVNDLANSPRTAWHDGKQYLVYDVGGYTEDLRIASRAPGGAWSENRIPGARSRRPVVLVSHGGELLVYYREAGGHHGEGSRLRLKALDAAGTWADRELTGTDPADGRKVPGQFVTATVMPGIVSHQGAVHAVWSEGARGLRYATLTPDGQAGAAFTFPATKPPQSRLSLVTYRDALHLIYAEGTLLKHWVKPDGKDWAAAPDGPNTGTTQAGVASVVYDGKIHTFYNVDHLRDVDTNEAIDAYLAKLVGPGFWVDLHGDGVQTVVRAADIRAADTKTVDVINSALLDAPRTTCTTSTRRLRPR